jgi:hypothetical protein
LHTESGEFSAKAEEILRGGASLPF